MQLDPVSIISNYLHYNLQALLYIYITRDIKFNDFEPYVQDKKIRS